MKIQESDLLKDSNNFDFVRILAATFVLIGHSPVLFKNQPFSFDPFVKIVGYPAHLLGLFIFFIISGFLITKSWETKRSVFDFIISRMVRIFPALLFTIAITTFILGPLLTTYSLTDYFKSEETYKHLLNISLYRIFYILPGVFEFNPYNNAVNGSIWSLAYEFTCYLMTIILGYIRFFKRKWINLSVYLFVLILFLIYDIDLEKCNYLIPLFGLQLHKFLQLYILFFSGSIFYQFRSSISFNWKTYLLILCFLILARFNHFSFVPNSIILTFLIFALVFSKKNKLNRFGKYGDFSYGIYLFAFPIQQAIAYLAPKETNLWLLIILSLLFTFIASIVCWNLIEKPSMKLKNKFLKNIRIN